MQNMSTTQKIIFGIIIFSFIPPQLFLVLLVAGGVYLAYKKISGEEVNIFGRKIVDAKVRDPFQKNNPIDMSVFTPKSIISLLIILIGVFIIIDGFVSVPAGHVAVIFDRGRGVITEELPEGLHLKVPFWQIATVIDTRLQSYTMSVAEGEGQRYGADAIEALTQDGQKVDLDVTIQFRIPGDKASDIYQTIGLDYEDKVIRPGVRSIVRDVVTGYDSTQLFTQAARTDAAQKMEDKLREFYAKSDIDLDKLLLRNVRFSDTYLKSIEDKQVAQQRIQKAEYEKLEAIEVKERKIIEAQAEAEAIRLKGETLKANPSVIQFEFVQKMAPNIQWGILPSGALPLVDLNSFKPTGSR